MRIHLFRLLFIATLTACSLMSYGQESTSNRPMIKIPEPIYILNTNIIGNSIVLGLDPKSIKDIMIYRENNMPNLLKNLAPTGIIAITYDGQINSKSFAEIGLQHGVKGPLGVTINGHKLDATQQSTLRIAPEAIGQLRVIPATAQNPETTVSIQLAEPKTSSARHAPGTVMIR